jgi:nucleoside 2-deoxyribosyltransferase
MLTSRKREEDMAYLHVHAALGGGGTKIVENKSEAEVLSGFVVPFLRDGTITTTWGSKRQTRQAHELRIYQTEDPFNKKAGGDFVSFVKGRKNRYPALAAKAEKLTGQHGARVFIVMPIQGDEYGGQEQQRVLAAFDSRFAALEETLRKLGCVAIRIDKEQPLEGMVERIKTEINRSAFVVADFTDERPSCYYEVGYADGQGIPVICIASQESVLHPGTPTKIHFDIHRQVLTFVNHKQMQAKLKSAFEKNKKVLLADRSDAVQKLTLI